MFLQLLAAGRKVRTAVVGSMGAMALRAGRDASDAQPGARALFIEADRHHEGGRSDDVAGSEFVDDRIRLRE